MHTHFVFIFIFRFRFLKKIFLISTASDLLAAVPVQNACAPLWKQLERLIHSTAVCFPRFLFCFFFCSFLKPQSLLDLLFSFLCLSLSLSFSFSLSLSL